MVGEDEFDYVRTNPPVDSKRHKTAVDNQSSDVTDVEETPRSESSVSPSLTGDPQPNRSEKSVKGKSLPEEAVKVMKTWFFEHLTHPYPSREEKRQMLAQSGLKIKQLDNWFVNARQRLIAPKRTLSSQQFYQRLEKLQPGQPPQPFSPIQNQPWKPPPSSVQQFQHSDLHQPMMPPYQTMPGMPPGGSFQGINKMLPTPPQMFQQIPPNGFILPSHLQQQHQVAATLASIQSDISEATIFDNKLVTDATRILQAGKLENDMDLKLCAKLRLMLRKAEMDLLKIENDFLEKNLDS
jgi:hypothetical protein